jgi:hypothetical protein
MSDTPETDAKTHSIFGSHSCATVLADFARKLERERDEARTELEMWRDGNILHEVHRNELGKVEQERDETREEIKKLIYIAERAIALAEIDFENEKFGVVSELRDGLERIKEGAK